MPDLTRPFARVADVARRIDGRAADQLELLRKLANGTMLVLASNLKGWEEKAVKENDQGKRVYTFEFYDVGRQRETALSTFTHLRLNGQMYAKGKSPLEPHESTRKWIIYVEPTGEKS